MEGGHDPCPPYFPESRKRARRSSVGGKEKKKKRIKIYIYILFTEKYTKIGRSYLNYFLLRLVSSSATRTRQGKRSRLPRKLQAASININSVAWKGRESYTPEFGLWSSLRSLSPSPIPTAGYVSDGQVARGGATGLEKTKGARENDREPERGKREGYRSGGRKEGKDGRYYLPPDAERSYLFGLSSTSFRATNYVVTNSRC